MWQKVLQSSGGSGGISKIDSFLDKSSYGTGSSGTLTISDFEVGGIYLLHFFQTASNATQNDIGIYNNSVYKFNFELQNFDIISETPITQQTEYKCEPFVKIVKAKTNASITWSSNETQTNVKMSKHCFVTKLK